MQNIANNANGIIKGWSLREFRDAFGKMSIGTSSRNVVNEETGEITKESFPSCCFTHPTTQARTFVGFGTSIGVLTAAEIKADVDNLRVVSRYSQTSVNEDGSPKVVYSLCKGKWEDIDF